MDISIEYEMLEGRVIAYNKFNRNQNGECALSDVNNDIERAKEIATEDLKNKISSDQNKLSFEADNGFTFFL